MQSDSKGHPRTNESREPYHCQCTTRNPQSDEERRQENTKAAASSGNCPGSNSEDDYHSSISAEEKIPDVIVDLLSAKPMQSSIMTRGAR